MTVLLTVVGRMMARPGAEFVFMGPDSGCKECKVKNICFHLEPGTKYRVVKARGVVHDCSHHEEGVEVVQVEAVPRRMAIPKKRAIEGTTITIELPKCGFRGCPHYGLCFPPGMEDGQKRTVLETGETLECAAGLDRVSAMVE